MGLSISVMVVIAERIVDITRWTSRALACARPRPYTVLGRIEHGLPDADGIHPFEHCSRDGTHPT